MSKKSDKAIKLLQKVELPYALPSIPADASILEAGLLAVLCRELPEARAKAGLEALKKAYPDLNEARVAQAQELAAYLAPKGKGVARLEKYKPAARLVQRYLKEVFQKSHGLTFDFLEEDYNAGVKLLAQMEFIGAAVGSVILFRHDGSGMPVSASLIRTLDRLGLMTRTSSVRKAREALDKLIPEKQRAAFAFGYGVVADRWCGKKPSCWECPLLGECPAGKKVHKEWVVQQERLEKQRAKEEARRIAQEKKDAERQEREAAREAKRQEAAAKKAKREAERRAAGERKKFEAERKRAAEKKAAEKKKAEAAKKKAAEAKKAARKKAAAKKKAAKKKVTKKKATKKASAKKAVAKKASKKTAKRAAKKTVTKKKVVKKAAGKSNAAKKKATKKKATKKATKKAAKKATKKAPRRR